MTHAETHATRSPGTVAQRIATAAPTEVVRLLHIEDNPSDALLIQEYIRGAVWGAEIDTVERLADVTAENAAVDCAILDLSLPDASGLEALVALRTLSSDLPIIVLSGLEDLELAVAALRNGADDYLMKNGADGETLRRAIRYAIERRRLRKALITEAAATTVATALVVTAEAALEVAAAGTVAAEAALEGALRAHEAPARARMGTAHPDRAAVDTHEVSVRIDDVTGNYALRCGSCSWAVDSSTEDGPHSWNERGLDQALLDHVDFGAIMVDALARPPAPGRRAVPEGVFGPRIVGMQQTEPPAAHRTDSAQR